jgi:hypothetical protein
MPIGSYQDPQQYLRKNQPGQHRQRGLNQLKGRSRFP